MILAFLNLGGSEVILILIVLLITIGVGNYGRNTALGYWGSIMLSLVASPLVAFAVIVYLKRKPVA